jgi:hypothetical protein
MPEARAKERGEVARYWLRMENLRSLREHQTPFPCNRSNTRPYPDGMGNTGLVADGVQESQSKILCMDYRDISRAVYHKIVCLEVAKHVGMRHFSRFLKPVYGLLDDDGVFLIQLS